MRADCSISSLCNTLWTPNAMFTGSARDASNHRARCQTRCLPMKARTRCSSEVIFAEEICRLKLTVLRQQAPAPSKATPIYNVETLPARVLAAGGPSGGDGDRVGEEGQWSNVRRLSSRQGGGQFIKLSMMVRKLCTFPVKKFFRNC